MSVFRRFKRPQLLRKHKSDGNSIVDIPRFDCNALAVKARLGQGCFGDVYTVDYKGPGKVIETVVVKKVLAAETNVFESKQNDVFIRSFEYRVTFLVKIRRFNAHRKWRFCIVGQWFLGKFSARSFL